MSSPAKPRVTFVVPCYNLAHLLGECVDSILGQSFRELEVIVMDDCSPDNTPAVAQALAGKDSRVRYVRNEVNLRHLANYNKGIQLASGEYVCVISADDKLRRPHVVEKFVVLMDSRPEVGFCFCPVMKFREAGEFALYGSCGDADRVFKGKDFLLERLFHGNIVPAPAGIARKSAWERAGLFPLDLPFAGDWYMWCAFALDADVGYFAEPMVSYRDHELNMTKFFKERANLLMADELAVLWRIFHMAEKKGDPELIAGGRRAIAASYVYRVVAKAQDPEAIGMTVEEFQESLRKHECAPDLAAECAAWVFTGLGDHCMGTGDTTKAAAHYADALKKGRGGFRSVAKYALARGGKLGSVVRSAASAVRDGIRGKSRST